MDFETEEQQLDAIKKWWHENSTMIIAGLAVGVSSIFGWQYYQQETKVHAEQASVIYEQVISNLQSPTAVNDQMLKVNNLQAEYSDTPYASLSSLLLAKQQLANGEFVKAQQQLDWVINNAAQDELVYLAKIRMARVLLSTEQVDNALVLLNQAYPDSFKAMALELKGDALLVKGEAEMARAAYQEASTLSNSTNRWLQLKIDDIALPADNNSSAADISEPSA